jgi:hypothetical protein
MEDGKTFRVVVTEQQTGPSGEPTLRDLRQALITVFGTDYGVCLPSMPDTYHAERHPVGAYVLRHTMAQAALQRRDDRTQALVEAIGELTSMGRATPSPHRAHGRPGHPLRARRRSSAARASHARPGGDRQQR